MKKLEIKRKLLYYRIVTILYVMEKIRFNLINMLLLLTLVSFTACKQDELPSQSGEKTIVRIQARLSGGFGEKPANTPNTRASSNWVEGSDGDEIYKPNHDPNNYTENYVSTIRVFAFNGDKAVLNKLFARNTSSVPGSVGFANGTTDKELKMDFSLPEGTYDLVLIANEAPAMGLASIATRAALNQVNVTNVLNAMPEAPTGIPAQGIPMVGEQKALRVIHPAGNSASQPWEVNPAIDLERTLAKVEFYLKNTDDNGKVYLSDSLTQFIGNAVELANVRENYMLMPGASMSGTPNKIILPLADNTIITNLTKLDLHDPFNNYVPKDGETFPKGKDADAYPLVWYIAPSTDAPADVKKATSILVHTMRISNADLDNDPHTQVDFNVPLYRTNGVSKNYNIERNTIYRIYAILKGAKLEVDVEVVVKGWVKKGMGNEDFSFGGSNGL